MLGVITRVPQEPKCLVGPPGLALSHHLILRHQSVGRRSIDSAPPVWLAAPVGTRGLFVERWACLHLRTAAHPPLGHARLPLDSFLPPRHHAYSANARNVFTGGLIWTLAPGCGFTAWRVKHGKPRGWRSVGPLSEWASVTIFPWMTFKSR